MVPRLYSIAQSWGCTHDVCEDLIQDTVSIALTKYSQLRDPDSFECWIIRILVNAHRQYLRKRKNLFTLEEDSLTDEFGPVLQLESSRTVARVQAAISLLSAEHQKILVLVDMEGMSYREVARVLDIKLGTVMSRLGRARNNLRQLLELRIQSPESNSNASSITSMNGMNLRRIK